MIKFVCRYNNDTTDIDKIPMNIQVKMYEKMEMASLILYVLNYTQDLYNKDRK